MPENNEQFCVPEIMGLEPTIKRLIEVEEGTFDDEILVSERTIFTELVHETRRIFKKYNPVRKPSINLGKVSIQGDTNCTDYSRVALALGDSINREGYGIFYQSHASVIISSDSSPDFWLIDGYSGAKADLNKILSPECNTDEVKIAQNAIQEMGDSKGAYVFWDTDSESWNNSYITTDNIRGESPFTESGVLSLSVSHSSMVIVGLPLAHRMLSAIDTLETFRKASRVDTDAKEMYEEAKQNLKKYCPRFS